MPARKRKSTRKKLLITADLSRAPSRTGIKKLYVPIYGATVWIVVAADLQQESLKARWMNVFGRLETATRYAAVARWAGGDQFCLLFKKDRLCLELVCHEVFHLTMHIANWWSLEHDVREHEATAALHGYLVDEVAKKLGLNWSIA